MKSKMKRLLIALLCITVMFAMSATVFAADDSGAAAGSSGASVKAADETTASTDVITDLSMFTPLAEGSSVKVNSNATVDVTIKTKPNNRKYTKLALVRESKTDAVKEAAAVKAEVTATSGEKYYSTFKFSIPVEKIGRKMAFSTYEVFTKSDGTKIDQWYSMTSQHYLTVVDTPTVVGSLIDNIYVQSRNAYTDRMCAQAKTSWDMLSAADQAKVPETSEGKGGPEYFGRDTGDAAADEPGNANGIGKKELLVVSFGTSFNDNRTASIGGVEDALVKNFRDYSVRRGFTSQVIINHIQARDGEAIDNIQQAMDRAVANGVKTLVVQPTHLMHGAEYDELKGEISKYSSRMQIVYGEPLLNSNADKEAVMKAVTADAVKDAGYMDLKAAKADNTAFVFMGHGTSHEANVTYDQMQTVTNKLGYDNCFIGTVEGKPADTALNAVIAKVKAARYTKVVLRPLMVVAGDHANNDMAGDGTDSWKTGFTKEKFTVSTQIKGLGELSAVQDIYIAHARAAVNSVVPEKTAAAKVKGTKISKLRAGKKKITVKISRQAGASGYQIRYAAKKSFKGAKKITLKGAGKTVKTIRSLKSGKKYYVQARVYKKSGGKKIYSAWSGTKSVKTK